MASSGDQIDRTTAVSDASANSPALPRLLLLSRTPPGDANVGQLFLRDLCASYPRDKLAFGVVQPELPDTDADRFPEVPKLYLRHEESRRVALAATAITELMSHLAFRHSRRGDRAVVDEFVRFGEAQRVDKIWAVLNSPLMYRIAPRVAARLNVPLVVTVWDPPDGIGLNLGLDRPSRALIRKDFVAALAKAERCGVISERMDREYRDLYGTDNVVVRHGIAVSEARRPPERDDSEFRIGFCGNLYAQSEWHVFLRALDHLGWHLGERPIRLIIAGFWVPFLGARTAARVDYVGWRGVEETVDLMSGCDFGYLPYWLDSAHAEPARLCFPAKLTTYMTAGLPVLYHGSPDAAVVDFLTRFPAAEFSHASDPEMVAESIRKLANTDRRRAMAAAAARAVAEELNLNVFRQSFRRLIGENCNSELRPP